MTTEDHLTTKAGYDRWAEVYDTEDNPLLPLEQPRMDKLLGRLRGLSVIDLGCGTGRHALRMAKAGASVEAVDFSAGMMGRARKKASGLPVRFHAHDLAKRLPFPAASFDRVVCGLVLDHIRDLSAFFKETRRLCKTDGFIAISTMHPALMLMGVQARFTDPGTGRKVYPASVRHQVSDYIMAVLNADLKIAQMTEHAVDTRFVKAHPKAEKYLGWTMLLMMKLLPKQPIPPESLKSAETGMQPN